MPRATRARDRSTGASKKAGPGKAHGAKRRTADPKSEILNLQHTAGNQAVSELLKKPARDLIGRGNSRGSGKPLDAKVQRLMESRLGHEFNDVRVHTDAQANESAKSLGAKAYTTGNDVVFAAGEYETRTVEGQQRIAHELAHIVQQRQSGLTSSRATELSSPRDASEREADAVGRSVARGMHAPSITAVGVSIQRDGGDKHPLLDDFEKKFADAAKAIRKNALALKLVGEAEAAGVKFGGFAEDGPSKMAWPYTIPSTQTVYVPKARTDATIAMSDFLFELNNAIRAPKLAGFQKEAAKGTKSKLTAKQYAYNMLEQEVEGMLRTGEIWFDMKKSLPKDPKYDVYDSDFFLASYKSVKEGKKTKDDIVKDLLKSPSGVDKTKTHEQFFIDQFNDLQAGK
jgi:hypothetical protein